MKANSKFLSDDHADMSGITMALSGVIAIMLGIAIGILVFYKINGSIATGSTAGATIHDQMNTTMSTVWTLMPIIAIIVIASLMIGIVTRFGSGGM